MNTPTQTKIFLKTTEGQWTDRTVTLGIKEDAQRHQAMKKAYNAALEANDQNGPLTVIFDYNGLVYKVEPVPDPKVSVNVSLLHRAYTMLPYPSSEANSLRQDLLDAIGRAEKGRS